MLQKTSGTLLLARVHIYESPVYKVLSKNQIVIFFPYLSVEACILGAQKEQSHRYCSFEYPQHMFWLRNYFFSIMRSYQEA